MPDILAFAPAVERRPGASRTDKQALVQFLQEQGIAPVEAVTLMLSLVADVVRPYPVPRQPVPIDVDTIVNMLQNYLMRQYQLHQGGA